MSANADRVLTHRQLLTKVWGGEFAQDHHTLRVHVANLRNKIEDQPERPRFIHTETRVGYDFARANPIRSPRRRCRAIRRADRWVYLLGGLSI